MRLTVHFIFMLQIVKYVIDSRDFFMPLAFGSVASLENTSPRIPHAYGMNPLFTVRTLYRHSYLKPGHNKYFLVAKLTVNIMIRICRISFNTPYQTTDQDELKNYET